MCKFVKELVVRKDEYPNLVERESMVRIFEPIRLNANLWLSIQASYAHYCTPRETIPNLEDYSHWEIALFDKDNFISVSSILPEFPSLAELELYFEGSVYPYVPKDLVEELYLALK